MQTNFSDRQLAAPDTAAAAAEIRKCVHCGFCTATCPTYVVLGNELDSPRGRIYLIKDMLENERRPDPATVRHLDRCLSCLSCRTTCPSDVDYRHLIDHARDYIERNHRRPWRDRIVRSLLAATLPFPERLRPLLRLARLARPLGPLLERIRATRPLAIMLQLAPARISRSEAVPEPAALSGQVIVLRGCVESVLQPQVRSAAHRVLGKLGLGILEVAGEGCCGSLVLHLGRREAARDAARRNIDAWWPAIASGGILAILVSASGCGLMVKDYGDLLRDDPAYADKAARVASLARDLLEFLDEVGLPAVTAAQPLRLAWHPPCSLQHGQRLAEVPPRLLRSLGHSVRLPDNPHLCCGSAGTYNILQPEIADELASRKAASLAALEADAIVTTNIGCAVQIERALATPVVHAIELIDAALCATAETLDPAPHEARAR